jgi:putative aldouronate transport system permease protein
MESQLYRNSHESRVFDAVIVVGLILVAAITLYPLIYTVVISLSTAYLPNTHLYLWPETATLTPYAAVLRNQLFLRSFANSILYTGAMTVISVTVTMATAYPLSLPNFPLRNFFMFFLMFTLLFNGGLVPYFLVVQGLGMVNTPWAMVIPGSISAFNVILARTYLQESIPNEVREAARVDGANDWTILLKVVFPLSKPIVAVIGLFTAVMSWNSYFPALLFLNDQSLFPVAMILRDIVTGQQATSILPADVANQTTIVQVQAATLVLATLPIAVIYPFLQRYFTRGIMIGAIKG